MNLLKKIFLLSFCVTTILSAQNPTNSNAADCQKSLLKLPRSTAGKGVLALVPFFGYLYYKNPEQVPTFHYTTDVKKKAFWTLKNFWYLFDEGLIGQRLKLKSVPVGDEGDKLAFRKKDCPPTGIVGHAESYINLGTKTGKTINKINKLVGAAHLLDGLFALI